MFVVVTLIIWVQKLTLVCKVRRCPGAKGRPPPKGGRDEQGSRVLKVFKIL
jgi:hypothetical protein